MKIKATIILFISLSISIVTYCQNTEGVLIETQINFYHNDTLSFNVYNNSPDTLFLSFFIESITPDNDTITNKDDIFCEPANPKETTIRLLPKEKIEIITKVYFIEFTGNKHTNKQFSDTNKYRLLTIHKSSIGHIKYYSKWFFQTRNLY